MSIEIEGVNYNLLFPHTAIYALRGTRGKLWDQLIDTVLALPESAPESLAFCLMMVHLNDCLDCEFGGHHHMNVKCKECSIRRVKKFKESDEQLLVRYGQALAEVRMALAYEAEVSSNIA